MNTFSKVLLAVGLTTAASSCSSFLDINTNPNQATAVTPPQLLANALNVTAALYTTYNAYGSFAASYWGKSNAVSGYNEERTYNYSSSYYSGLWLSTYDNLEDYRQIRVNSLASSYPNHAAIARIMQVYDFLLLVDEYGDVPYTQALLGTGNTQPTFDKQQDIYKDLVVQLKGAISDINAATAAAKPTTEDIVFAGNMNKWKAFANSLRLRILLRESSTSDASLNSYVATEMALLNSPDGGFITTDVISQPGYASNSGQQNPFYNTYGFAVGTTNTTSTYKFTLPTTYYVNLNLNLSDPRITQQYKTNNTGIYRGTILGESAPPSPTTGSTLLVGGEFLRSSSQPTPLMLLAEQLFSKAEAENRGLLTGTASEDYYNGIRASFQTVYRTGTTLASPATVAATTQSEAYLAANTGNGLVNWDASTTPTTDAYGNVLTGTSAGTRTVTKQEKIQTQKWLAETVWASIEGWDGFRRTRFPVIPISREAATSQFPARLFYPQSEINTNSSNVPSGITQYTKLFWAQ